MADDEQFSLCWNNFNSNLSAGFHESLQRGDLVDVTLAAEGQLVQAHRLVLSVCSPYFRKMFNQMPKNQHAFVFLKDVTHSALQDLIQFMYCGEVNVKQDALPAFISTAEALQIKGLTETGDSAPSQQSPIKDDTPAVPVATASISTTVPATSQRTKVQRNRIQSYKLESEESGDDKIVHLQTASTSHHVTTAQQLQVQTSSSSQKRVMPQRGLQSHASKRTKLSISASSDGLDTSDTGTTPTQTQTVQTVQIVKQIPAQLIEPEYIELPIESINPKAEPDYTEETAEIETVDAETEQEHHKLSEHDQGDADDDGNYVEDETYGDMGMSKYEESYLTEGEESAKPGVSGFVDSYTSDGGTGTEQSTQVPLFNLMEPAIKIEEDSTDFGEFAFLSEQHLMEDITDSIKKSSSSSSNTSKRSLSRKRKLDIAELFQLSSCGSTAASNQRNLIEKPFPILTIAELNEFDTLLLGNLSFTEKCAQMLHSVIRDEGNSLDNATCHMRLLLEHAIDYSVILRYSWYGFMPRSPAARSSGEQHPFRNLLGVISLLHRARQLRFATCSREEINEGIEKFLKRKLRCHALFVKKQQLAKQLG
ncbi:modifier of mdg4-like [Anopheles maculipalpis]|uniref:modifier of mdg4-like n=1 Tax=Anopheles maculipalpis TaxID=1496333 RepID=UPI002158C0EA|nr:modifier of mdg4-like [Anopheles maculipalpis]